MTPREYESVLLGLREYHEEEQRQARQAMAASGGTKVQGGGVVRND